jgi:hypothetical protein
LRMILIWSAISAALALGGCATTYEECSDYVNTPKYEECHEETRLYYDQRTLEDYLVCRQIAEAQGHVWMAISRGYVPRDRKTGIPRHALDQRREIADNGCRI